MDRSQVPPPGLSDSELEVLKVLWDRGTGTVREVNAELSRLGRRWAYTTVQTLLALTAKGIRDQHQRGCGSYLSSDCVSR